MDAMKSASEKFNPDCAIGEFSVETFNSLSSPFAFCTVGIVLSCSDGTFAWEEEFTSARTTCCVGFVILRFTFVGETGTILFVLATVLSWCKMGECVSNGVCVLLVFTLFSLDGTTVSVSFVVSFLFTIEELFSFSVLVGTLFSK